MHTHTHTHTLQVIWNLKSFIISTLSLDLKSTVNYKGETENLEITTDLYEHQISNEMP